jgi:hypothetical protein
MRQSVNLGAPNSLYLEKGSVQLVAKGLCWSSALDLPKSALVNLPKGIRVH